MSYYTPIFPEELITDILIRLPAKSIGKFRCVSKPWRSLLSTPQFIKSHLAYQSSCHGQEKLILISSLDNSLFTLTLSHNSSSSSSSGIDDGVSKDMGALQCQDRHDWEMVAGSCHGLILVVDDDDEDGRCLINPTTLEFMEIPDFSLALDPSVSFSMDGFGYDSNGDDYKIVTLSYYDKDIEHELDCGDTYVDVFSLKMGSWRRIGSSPYDHAVPELTSGVFSNGAIHWLACDTNSTENYPLVIVAFNLSREEFQEVPPPNSLDKSIFEYCKLVGLGGCLGMVVDLYDDQIDDDQIDVWVMKDYGVQESWSKFTVGAPDYFDTFKPICHLGEKVVVFQKDCEKLVSYNLTEETLRDMVISGIPDNFKDGAMTYVESLVRPCFYSRNEERHIPEGEY